MTGGSRKRKRRAVNSRSAATPGASKLKFKETSDPWNVGPKVWERFGRNQKVIAHLSSPISATATAPQQENAPLDLFAFELLDS